MSDGAGEGEGESEGQELAESKSEVWLAVNDGGWINTDDSHLELALALFSFIPCIYDLTPPVRRFSSLKNSLFLEKGDVLAMRACI
jgi:hypothetical protein